LGECEEVPRRLLEACGDGAEALQVVEEALDEIALAVQCARLRQLARSLELGADDGPLLLISNGLPESARVVAGVGDERLAGSVARSSSAFIISGRCPGMIAM
jgi:hypothetical protein